eukprot:COSAG01_NODE_61_length_29729_cov_196.711779_11_plen_673_part_00
MEVVSREVFAAANRTNGTTPELDLVEEPGKIGEALGTEPTRSREENNRMIDAYACRHHIERGNYAVIGFTAARWGDKDILEILSVLGGQAKDSLSVQDLQGSTLAHIAASKGHPECLRVLHELGARDFFLTQNEEGDTPAHLAAKNGHEECLRFLDELGARDSFLTQDADGDTPAHVAAYYGHPECLKVLDELGARDSFLTQNKEEYTPAHLAAEKGQVECLIVLYELGAGASFSVQDSQGSTLAHIAASNGHEECLRVLDKLGVDLSVKDKDGDTPAHIAASNGHEECLRVLDELGARDSFLTQNDKEYTPASLAVRYDHPECLRVLDKLGVDLSVKDKEGSILAHVAAWDGHEECLRVLDKLGVDLSVKGKDGDTPAHWAAYNGHEEFLRVLYELRAGESLSVKDKDGDTPAHLAACNGHEECLRVLALLGADISGIDDRGTELLARDLTEIKKLSCLSQLLLSKKISIYKLVAKYKCIKGLRYSSKANKELADMYLFETQNKERVTKPHEQEIIKSREETVKDFSLLDSELQREVFNDILVESPAIENLRWSKIGGFLKSCLVQRPSEKKDKIDTNDIIEVFGLNVSSETVQVKKCNKEQFEVLKAVFDNTELLEEIYWGSILDEDQLKLIQLPKQVEALQEKLVAEQRAREAAEQRAKQAEQRAEKAE